MSPSSQPTPDPEPPRPPGTPELDLDVPVGEIPGGAGERPESEDVTDGEAPPEPPD